MCIDILRCHHFRCSKIFHQNRCSVSSLIKDIINNCLLTNNLFRWFDIARSCSWFALFRHLVKHVQIHYSFERELFWKSLYGLGDQNLPDMCQLHITSCHFLSVECAQQNNMMLNNYFFIDIIIILYFTSLDWDCYPFSYLCSSIPLWDIQVSCFGWFSCNDDYVNCTPFIRYTCITSPEEALHRCVLCSENSVT